VLPPVAIVWPCPLSVDAYVAAGRDVEVPRPVCPRCGGATTWWSGYRRFVRSDGASRAIFVRRVRCGRCQTTEALLPAFVFYGRLDVVESIGEVLEAVAVGPGGVRPAAAALDVPHTTARGWVRRFAARAAGVSVGFAALAVELGGEVVDAIGDVAGHALVAIAAAFGAAGALPGWGALGCWRFVSAVSGGRVIATNTNTPYLIVGRRRFMPPVPSDGTRPEE
jgi:ribosomal protein S27AE